MDGIETPPHVDMNKGFMTELFVLYRIDILSLGQGARAEENSICALVTVTR
jgi:hypothetical protein